MQKTGAEELLNPIFISTSFGLSLKTDKNKSTTPDKMEIKKFDPVARKHVIYKEDKIK